LELVEGESSVSVLVVPGHEKLALLEGRVDTNGVESGLEIVDGDLSISRLVEDLESIPDVEVGLGAESDLGLLELLLVVAEVLESMDQGILVVETENGLPAGRCP